jgi:hypothetical protein
MSYFSVGSQVYEDGKRAPLQLGSICPLCQPAYAWHSRDRKVRVILGGEDKVKTLKLLTIVFATALATGAQRTGSKHKISVTFNYDFTHTPVCPAKTAKTCVEQFNLYDISAGVAKRTKLMSFPPPLGATGAVKGITAITPLLLFEPGKHLLAVTAQMSKGDESDPNKCTIWVEIP